MHHYHLAPMEPVWLISLVLITFAAEPHHVPVFIYNFAQTLVGAVVLGAVAVAVSCYKPILGTALLIFLVSMILDKTHSLEGFEPSNLNKDIVPSKDKRWFVEAVLKTDPRAIQVKTEDPTLTKDIVEEKNRWHDERVLKEHTVAIQDRDVSDVPMYTRSGYSWHK
jgi:hypothetical protein